MQSNSNQTTELLTPDELAHMLKISKVGVYRLVDKRLIRFYKVMGSIRFEKNDVLTYLQNNRVESGGINNNYGSTKI